MRLIDPEISPDGKAIVVVVGRANLDEDRTDNAYQAGIWNDAGQGPGEDVMAGLAALEMRGIVDESNIAVSGWSYGGFMTSWLLGHSSIWKASVDGAAANSWLDMYNLSDRNVTTAEGFGGSPYTSPERMKAYLDRSPISYVQNVRTPTLVMCDVGDYRAPSRSHASLDPVARPLPAHGPGSGRRSAGTHGNSRAEIAAASPSTKWAVESPWSSYIRSCESFSR